MTSVMLMLLALVTAGVYLPTMDHGLLQWDDAHYITRNPHVLGGLTWENLHWAVTTDHGAMWTPLLWLSYMMDVTLWGPGAWGFHLSNLLLHTANAVLLALALARLTQQTLSALIAAALFALHPQHVESVAWVAERKDVLSQFWGLLTLLAWSRYLQGQRVLPYLAALLAHGLGLASKATWVTLPVLLLLLDYWPLQRRGWRLVWEKLPLALLSLVAASMALVTAGESANASLTSWEMMPLAYRLENTLVSHLHYLKETLLPVNLAALHLHPPGLDHPNAITMAAAALLASLTVLAWQQRRTRPYLLVGWLWYLVAMAPMAQLIVVGYHARADRFTYLPHVGLFMAVAWGVAEAMTRFPRARQGILTGVALTLLALAGTTTRQAGIWRDDATLWQHTARVTEHNYYAWWQLGYDGLRRGDAGQAEEAFSQSVAAFRRHVPLDANNRPAYTPFFLYDAMHHLGLLRFLGGEKEEGRALLSESLTRDTVNQAARCREDRAFAARRVPELSQALATLCP